MESTFENVINFALEKEKEAVTFYEELSAIAKRPNAKAMFESFVKEEKGHVRLLEGVNEENIPEVSSQKPIDLKISDYLIDMAFRPDIDYQDALIIAMKREEKAVQLYEYMLEKAGDPKLKKLLQFMVQEEAKHKLRLETEYDEVVLKED
jgi:rubrerythrin